MDLGCGSWRSSGSQVLGIVWYRVTSAQGVEGGGSSCCSRRGLGLENLSRVVVVVDGWRVVLVSGRVGGRRGGQDTLEAWRRRWRWWCCWMGVLELKTLRVLAPRNMAVLTCAEGSDGATTVVAGRRPHVFMAAWRLFLCLVFLLGQHHSFSPVVCRDPMTPLHPSDLDPGGEGALPTPYTQQEAAGTPPGTRRRLQHVW